MDRPNRPVLVCITSDNEEGLRDEQEDVADRRYPAANNHPDPEQNNHASESEPVNEVSSNSQRQVEDLCQSSDERVLGGEHSRRAVVSTLNQKNRSGPPVIPILSGEDSIEMTKPVKRGWVNSSHARGSRVSPARVPALEIIQEESTVEITMEQSRSRTHLLPGVPQTNSLSSTAARRAELVEASLADDGLEELTRTNRGKPWGTETLVIDEDSRQTGIAKTGSGKLLGSNGRVSQRTNGRSALNIIEDSDPKVVDSKPDENAIRFVSEESVRNAIFDEERLSKLYNALYLFTYEPLKVLGGDDKSANHQGNRTVKGETEIEDAKLDEYSNNPTFGTDEYKPELSMPCKIVEDPKEIAKLRYKGIDAKLITDFNTEWSRLQKLIERIKELSQELEYTENPHLRPPPPPVQPVLSPKFEADPVEGKISGRKTAVDIKHHLLQSTDSEEDRPIEGLDDIYDFDQHLVRKKKESRIKKPKAPLEYFSPKRAEVEWAHRLIQEQLGVTDLKVMTNEDYLKLMKGSSRKKRSSRSNSRRRSAERFLRSSKSKSKSKSRSRSRRRMKELERNLSRTSSARRSRSRGSRTHQQPMMGYPPQFYPRHFKDFRYRPGEMIRTADGRIFIPKRLPDKHNNYAYPGYPFPGASSTYLRMRDSKRKRSRSRSNPKFDYPPHMLPMGRVHRSGQKLPFVPEYDPEYYYPPYTYDSLGEMPPLGKRWPKSYPGFAENERFTMPDGFHPTERKSRKSSTSRRSKSKSLRKEPIYSTEDELIERLRAQTSQPATTIPPKEEAPKEEDALSEAAQPVAPVSKAIPELERLLRERKTSNHRLPVVEEYFARDSSPGDELEYTESTQRMLISPTTQRKLRQITMENSFSSAGPVRAVKRASAVSTSNSALHELLGDDTELGNRVQQTKQEAHQDRAPATSSQTGFERAPTAQDAEHTGAALMEQAFAAMESQNAGSSTGQKRSKKTSTPGPNLWALNSKDPASSPDFSAITKHIQSAVGKKRAVRAAAH